MLDAAGILTARGGMTSHAAVVARGMGKVLRIGRRRELEIDYKAPFPCTYPSAKVTISVEGGRTGFSLKADFDWDAGLSGTR